jgi:ABC-type Fe3+-hydroxamate transport system substrate-binding protein
VKIKVKNNSTSISFAEMRSGQVGRITTPGSYCGLLVMKFGGDCIADLNGKDYWLRTQNIALEVNLLPPGTIIELTTEL